ncbi:hypothetical protein ATY41_08140 [Leifsonia xyli subsp. xyli]|uniref:ABC transporter domain-containing protein n=1 Tax=Leifsonia xyli subsp. xyli TaxID=59736 RepID=A0A1E2SLZ7_LEIXY|nr:ABC transporter ATP-binding protein [Leifsonia xyli]ODA90875.1 hypothetical protein ATY41_08140 [Leifsonia xyli subsp. xyli]
MTIALSGLTVSYGGADPVLSNIDLRIERGEFVTLLGSSGCGKSTLLRTVAGFVPAASGRIEVNGVDVTSLAPENRGVGFVFQNYALFPHLSVRGNVEFGLRARRLGLEEISRRVADTLDTTGLASFAEAMPAELSGGQQQRVAIARVLATEPSLLLMDEPLSNLDVKLRLHLRTEIQSMHRELGITTLYVTHDQEEALALSDRVAVMRDGRFEQVGTPHTVYHSPGDPLRLRLRGKRERRGRQCPGTLRRRPGPRPPAPPAAGAAAGERRRRAHRAWHDHRSGLPRAVPPVRRDGGRNDPHRTHRLGARRLARPGGRRELRIRQRGRDMAGGVTAVDGHGVRAHRSRRQLVGLIGGSARRWS